MKCPGREDKIHAYIKKRMTAQEASEFERHLKTCEACRRSLELNLRLDERLSLLTAPEPGPEFADRVAARIDSGRSRGLYRQLFRLPALSAAVLLLAVVGLGLWREQSRFAQWTETEVVGQYEFLTKLELLQEWDLLNHWDQVEAQMPIQADQP